MLRKERNYGCRYQEIAIYDHKSIILENELIRIIFVVGKGCEIVEFNYKKKDIDFVWRTDKGLSCLENYSKNYNDDNVLTDYYTGGWFEAFPICGSGGEYKGVSLPVYGEVCYLPWEYDVVKDTKEEVILKAFCKTIRTPFYIEKYFKIRSYEPALYLGESINNLSNEKLYFNIGYHPNFGKSFIDNDIKIEIKDCNIEVLWTNKNSRFNLDEKGKWPYLNDKNGRKIDLRYIPAANSKINEILNLKGIKDGIVILKNKTKNIDFKLSFDKKVYKNAILWIVRNGDFGYPRYGNTDVLCILPKSNHYITLKDCLKNNDFILIDSKNELKTWIKFEIVDLKS